MSPYVIGWLAAMVVFVLAEAATVELVSIWFMGGAFAAMLAAIFNTGFPVQLALFVAVSGLLLILLRPVLKKKLTPKRTRTNADRLIGREALVTEPIDDLRATGAVRIDGVLWTARSESGLPIAPESIVVITRIEGAKVFVRPAELPVAQ